MLPDIVLAIEITGYDIIPDLIKVRSCLPDIARHSFFRLCYCVKYSFFIIGQFCSGRFLPPCSVDLSGVPFFHHRLELSIEVVLHGFFDDIVVLPCVLIDGKPPVAELLFSPVSRGKDRKEVPSGMFGILSSDDLRVIFHLYRKRDRKESARCHNLFF